MDIRRATLQDLDAVAVLLDDAQLPPLPSRLPRSNVLVAFDGSDVRGAIALEVVRRLGLVRSAVVEPSERDTGTGSSLLRSLIARAHELGLQSLYLLTEDAADFFAQTGFAEVDRTRVPREIRMTQAFREECPDTATVMCLELATRYV